MYYGMNPESPLYASYKALKKELAQFGRPPEYLFDIPDLNKVLILKKRLYAVILDIENEIATLTPFKKSAVSLLLSERPPRLNYKEMKQREEKVDSELQENNEFTKQIIHMHALSCRLLQICFNKEMGPDEAKYYLSDLAEDIKSEQSFLKRLMK